MYGRTLGGGCTVGGWMYGRTLVCAAVHTSHEGVWPDLASKRHVDSFLISFPTVLKLRTLKRTLKWC